MNKKLLFGIMSLAALTACTNDEFESQNVAAETSPVQFEVINDVTRASMDGNTIVWNANQGDIFTLYHGSTAAGFTTGYENATYTANANPEGNATLTTPTMIKEGKAIMVWPVDTTFRIKFADALTLKIPAELKNVEHNIPYVSDLLDIQPYAAYSETGAYPTAYSTAGKGRKYPIYMRPMASQLTVNADYVGTDATLQTLYDGGSEGLTGDDAITPISLTSVDLLTRTGGATVFTTEIPLKFTAPSAAIQGRWNTVPHNKYNATNTMWNQVTDFDVANIAATGQVNKLTTEVIDGTESCKFLILPQANMTTVGAGVLDGGIIVNTYYGRVVIAAPTLAYSNANYGYKPAATGAVSAYTAAEYAKAWYRYISSTTAAADGETKTTTKGTGDNANKFKTTANIEMGLKQTINVFSAYTQQSGVVKDEPTGTATTRYVEVRLNHLDMSDLHIKSDKQLRDVVRVWKKLNLPSVTVLLDGNGSNEFEMSQKSIQLINQINASTSKSFTVMPCDVASHKACNTIVITGGGELQDITFIEPNGTKVANVALKAGENWKWKAFDAGSTNKTLKAKAAGVAKIINRGTFVSDATAVLRTAEPNGTQNFIPFENARNATWNVNNNATIRVQLSVTNNGTVNIEAGSQYRQDGNAGATTFTNQASAVPTRFTYAATHDDSKIGTVNNAGVFATLNTGTTAKIINYGLINHNDVDAKTYITENQLGTAPFTTVFGASKMGMIKLPWNNRFEDNVSVSATAATGFVAVETQGSGVGNLQTSAFTTGGVLSTYVNYIMVNGDVTEIQGLAGQFKYVEINQGGEVAWKTGLASTYTGLMVLSPVNIKYGTTVTVSGASYLGADMYVGGNFTWGSWNGYFGNTAGNASTKYITY